MPLVIVLVVSAFVAAAGCGREGSAPEIKTTPEVASERKGSELDEQEFWTLIRKARGRSRRKDGRAFEAALTKRLAKRSPEEIVAFARIWQEKRVESYRWDLWGAAYLINGGCSDDCFDYFCDFLISMGRETYEAALRNPESLEDFPTEDDVEWEGPGYAASKAYERTTGGELPFTGPRVPFDPAGKEWSEEELPDLFPRLAKRFA